MTGNNDYCCCFNAGLFNQSPALAELNDRVADILQDMSARYSEEDMRFVRSVLVCGGLAFMAFNCSGKSN